MKIVNERLFLKYAIPCSTVLIKRGSVSKNLMRSVKTDLVSGKPIKTDIRKIFKVAYIMCSIIAKKMGKNEIDDEVIRKYFWLEHEKAIKWRMKIHKDIDVKSCLCYLARIVKSGKSIMAKTSSCIVKVKNDFVPEIKNGDLAVIHYDYIVEKISDEDFKKFK